jgi:Periplasmic binding protein
LIGKELAEGTILVGTSVEKGSAKIDAFKQRIAKLYPGKPYGLVYMVGYESLFLLKAGIEKSGSATDINKIAGAFDTAVTPQTSPLGLWLTVKNGEAQFDLNTVEVKNGQVIPVK